MFSRVTGANWLGLHRLCEATRRSLGQGDRAWGGRFVTLFRRSNDVEVSISPEFDREYRPEEMPIHTGIYRCRGCGCEIVAEANKPFPPEKHPRHSPAQ